MKSPKLNHKTLQLDELSPEVLDIIETVFSGFDGAIIIDDKGTILIFTEYYEEISGFKREDVLGRHILDIFPESRLLETIETGKPIIADVWGYGHRAHIVSRIPIISRGQIIGAAGVSIFRYMDEARNFAVKFSNLSTELAYYKEQVKHLSHAKYSLAGIIGKSEAILEAKDRVRRIARTNSPVLIYGETGTGKELFAHAIHEESRRRNNPFIGVNCASIPENLLESELFGYEEGAFTGAKRGGKPGRFELANRGSIFLDEISDLPYIMQPKLLRVLQEQELERVGGTRTIPLDVRIISATNVDLRQGAGLKHFREDLFYRLNVFQVIAPPLRERREDIPMLCEYFIGKYNRENGTEIQGISKEALTLMRNYSWPGNVRELETLMERACVDADKGIIDVDNLTRFGGRNLQHQLHGAPNHPHIRSLKEGRESGEKDAIEAALKAANGNKTRAAQMLGIHRTYLYHKLKELGIVED
ncbi:MAG: sigma 54-interacting transcriptional regulator [Syntrophomonadaceae bacterium]|nr:sigma 54-interacting transcriptional regulator [Syntrophomonadaceae bacterium]